MSADSPTILIVEDEPTIADTLTYALETEGFATRWVSHGREALEIVAQEPPALILLDVGLPDISGFDVCRDIRKTSSVPIIFITARSEDVDCVVGLEIGGDDYVVKPFSPRVVTARVRARLRALTPGDPEVPPAAHDFRVDAHAYDVHLSGRPLGLARYEFRILQLLIEHPRRVYSRAQLMDLLWEEPERSYDRTVDTHIKTVRRKIKALAPDLEVIRTHRGIGYSFEPG